MGERYFINSLSEGSKYLWRINLQVLFSEILFFRGQRGK